MKENGGIRLRDYQAGMVEHLLHAWERHRSVMVQMPTGTGKTHVLAAAIRETLLLQDASADAGAPPGQAWIVTHRRELVSQIKETVARYVTDRTAGRIKVFSIQWLSRNREKAEGIPCLIVVDEAHHAPAASYRELWTRYPGARKLGVTATPCRMDGSGFTELFEVLLQSWSVAGFIRRGVLSSFDYISIRPDSEEQRLIDSLQKRGADGDYQVKEMDGVLNRQPNIRRLHEGLRKYAAGKKGIVYAVSVAHAGRIAAYYSSHGTPAVAIDGGTPATVRKERIGAFREGKVQVLVNVDVFSEGFDCPDVEFVQLARPTLSLARYLQQVGRGLRKAAGKESCVLIDHVGLYRLFGLPVRGHDWQAMFEGRLRGKAVAGRNRPAERYSAASAVPPADGCGDGELELVVSHERLLAGIREQAEEEAVEHVPEEVRPFRDRRSGLWGLRCGETRTAAAQFTEILDVREGRAAVRYGNGRAALVDASGKELASLGRCLRARLLPEGLAAVTEGNGTLSWLDLRTGRRFPGRPKVLHYGNVELLKYGGRYHSRTRHPYTSCPSAGLPAPFWAGWYLKIPETDPPRGYRPIRGTACSSCMSACLIEGDEEEVYWFCGQLEDGSIVVSDRRGDYYHADRPGKKRLIARASPQSPEERPEQAIPLLLEEARERAEKRAEEERQAEQARRERRLQQIGKDVQPFRMGTKWGLKSEGRIVVPPLYRKVLPPVGGYCAYEEHPCRWGVMELDGKVVVEAKYAGVDIGEDGQVRLTVYPGKTETRMLKR